MVRRLVACGLLFSLGGCSSRAPIGVKAESLSTQTATDTNQTTADDPDKQGQPLTPPPPSLLPGDAVTIGDGGPISLSRTNAANRQWAMSALNGLKVNNGFRVNNGLYVLNGLKVLNGLDLLNGLKVNNGFYILNGLFVLNGIFANIGIGTNAGVDWGNVSLFDMLTNGAFHNDPAKFDACLNDQTPIVVPQLDRPSTACVESLLTTMTLSVLQFVIVGNDDYGNPTFNDVPTMTNLMNGIAAAAVVTLPDGTSVQIFDPAVYMSHINAMVAANLIRPGERVTGANMYWVMNVAAMMMNYANSGVPVWGSNRTFAGPPIENYGPDQLVAAAYLGPFRGLISVFLVHTPRNDYWTQVPSWQIDQTLYSQYWYYYQYHRIRGHMGIPTTCANPQSWYLTDGTMAAAEWLDGCEVDDALASFEGRSPGKLSVPGFNVYYVYLDQWTYNGYPVVQANPAYHLQGWSLTSVPPWTVGDIPPLPTPQSFQSMTIYGDDW